VNRDNRVCAVPASLRELVPAYAEKSGRVQKTQNLLFIVSQHNVDQLRHCVVGALSALMRYVESKCVSLADWGYCSERNSFGIMCEVDTVARFTTEARHAAERTGGVGT
jgi:hypothetical protein